MADGTGDKLEGKANELKGTVKQGVGEVTGDASLQAEGMADAAKGNGQGVLGEAKDVVHNAADTVREQTR